MDGGPYLLYQRVSRHWLPHPIAHTFLEHPLKEPLVVGPAVYNDGNSRVISPEIGDELHPTAIWHDQVADDRADCACQHRMVHQLHRTVAVGGQPHLIPLSTERQAGSFSKVGIVIDHQNCPIHLSASLQDK